MNLLLPIIAVVLVLAVIVVVVLTVTGRSKGGGSGPAKRERNRDAVIRDANKRLTQNPRDYAALNAVGNVYYRESQWDEAYKAYEILVNAPPATSGVDSFEVNLRCGISALNLGKMDEAYKGLFFARNLRQDNFEANYHLGSLEFQRKNYERAVNYLQIARRQDGEHVPTLRTLGHAFFKVKKYKEAMAFIRKAIDLAPDDKESLYTLGECYHEAEQTDQALKIFTRLRPDPVMGANACLLSGTINTELRQYDKAIEDFEIGLRHKNITPEVWVDIKYRLAKLYIETGEIGKALTNLKDIQLEHSNYKDVAALISKYRELNANKNLQIYMIGSSADFIALCRKIVVSYFPKARVKITNISVNKNEWADILAEVDTAKMSDVVMFRFIRSQGSIGEIIVRDFHSHLKEVKAGKGICTTVGTFSDEARRYTEARLIDLIEKERLTPMLNLLDMSAA
ncbi:MAG: tetratricopeptide repeat protein, partial [Treponema sp.]|nr:tetratricopeptide repeat protein [Treponema sp.]